MNKHATPAEIIAARQAAGHTQKQAAELLGYTERGWRHWENGTRAMRSVLLSQYCAMAGVNPTIAEQSNDQNNPAACSYYAPISLECGQCWRK